MCFKKKDKNDPSVIQFNKPLLIICLVILALVIIFTVIVFILENKQSR